MKKAILAGAVAALMWGSAAYADCPKQTNNSAGASTSASTPAGSASVSTDADMQTGTGGSGTQNCPPAASSSTTTTTAQPEDSSAYGGSGYTTPQQQPTTSSSTTTTTSSGAFDTTAQDEDDDKDDGPDMRGVTVTAGGGVEGYAGDLASTIDPGPAWNLNVGLRPSKVLGLEFGYSGAINDIDGVGTGGTVDSNPDLMRNGGHAAVTLGLASTGVQPYVLGGIGLSRYNVRNGEGAEYKDDTTGNVPVGLGLRTHFGDFTADLRGTYNFLFDQEFAARAQNSGVGGPGDSSFDKGGRYMGTLNIGATF